MKDMFSSKLGLIVYKQLLISLEWPRLPLTGSFNTAPYSVLYAPSALHVFDIYFLILMLLLCSMLSLTELRFCYLWFLL